MPAESGSLSSSMYLDPVAWTTGGAVQSVDTFKIPVPGFFHPLKVVSRTGEQGGVAQAGRPCN